MRTRLIWSAILTTYLTASVAIALTKRPWCDEAWLALPALGLMTKGYMGTTNLDVTGTALAGLDRYTYWIMPLHAIVQTGWYSVVGFGLIAMRVLSMVFGVLALVSCWAVVKRLSGSERAAILAVALLAVDFIFVRGASDGRMDVMCAAFGFAGLAAYLSLRERHLDRAVFFANACAAAGLLTHPGGISAAAGVVLLALVLDRSRLRWRHVLVAGVPYLIGFGAWGAYILQQPAMFLAQFGGNAQGRWAGLSSLVDHIVVMYGPAFGFTSHWAGPIVYLRILILIGYLAGVAGLILTPVLRRQPGVRVLLMLTAVYFVTQSLFGSANAHDYLVHIVPLYLACLATWTVWVWEHRSLPRPLVAVAMAGFVLLQTGSIAARVVSNPYARSFRPAVAYLEQHVPPGATVMASAEFGFHLGFVPELVDDMRLGYYSGKQADYIVVDDRYADWFNRLLAKEPDVQRHVLQTLEQKYVKVYDSPLYAIYRSRTSRVAFAAH